MSKTPQFGISFICDTCHVWKEVDLVFTNGPDFFPVEIKAGMTVTRDYFKGLKHFRTQFTDRMPNGAGLVYSGEEAQNREGVSIVPARSVNRLFETSEI